MLAMPNRNTSFQITLVKPFYTTLDTPIEEPQEEHTRPQAPANDDTIVVQPLKRPRGRPRKQPPALKVFLQDDIPLDPQFLVSRHADRKSVV